MNLLFKMYSRSWKKHYDGGPILEREKIEGCRQKFSKWYNENRQDIVIEEYDSLTIHTVGIKPLRYLNIDFEELAVIEI